MTASREMSAGNYELWKHDEPPRVLTTVSLNLTGACNLQCIHCMPASGRVIPNDELDTKEIIALVHYLGDHGIPKIHLTGGEPLLRPDFEEIFREFRPWHLFMVSSNGTLVTDRIARLLAQRRLYVDVSLDGPSPAVHDKIRGEGAFDAVIRGIKCLRKHGVDVKVNFVIMKTNFHYIAETAQLAEQLGLKGMTMVLCKNIGRAAESRVTLSFDEIELAHRQTRKAEEACPGFNILSDVEDRLRFLRRTFSDRIDEMARLASNRRIKPLAVCSVGRNSVSIKSNGSVVPCNNLLEVSCGNIRQRSLDEIWSKSEILKELYSCHHTPKSKTPACKECPYLCLCGVGCRASAYHHSGDFFSPDPQWCILELRKSIDAPCS